MSKTYFFMNYDEKEDDIVIPSFPEPSERAKNLRKQFEEDMEALMDNLYKGLL